MLTLQEFINTVYHTRKYIILPSLNRLKIEKTKFIIKGKYDIKEQNKYLEYLYNKNYGKIIR